MNMAEEERVFCPVKHKRVALHGVEPDAWRALVADFLDILTPDAKGVFSRTWGNGSLREDIPQIRKMESELADITKALLDLPKN